MKGKIDDLLDATRDVVDEDSFAALDDMSFDELRTQVRRDMDAGRMQAVSARHHALRAKAAWDAGDEDEAFRHLIMAQSRWIQAQEANIDPRKKEKRLTRMPNPPGGKTLTRTERLHTRASALMEQGVGKMEALRRAVSNDAFLAQAYRNAKDDTLKKAFKRVERKRLGTR